MKERLLNRTEWDKLKDTGFPEIVDVCPGNSEIAVVEDGDRIVAVLGVVVMTHFEGLWIDPEYRGNAGVARRLMRLGVDTAKEFGNEWIWASAGGDFMGDIFARLGGTKMPTETYIVPIH